MINKIDGLYDQTLWTAILNDVKWGGAILKHRFGWAAGDRSGEGLRSCGSLNEKSIAKSVDTSDIARVLPPRIDVGKTSLDFMGSTTWSAHSETTKTGIMSNFIVQLFYIQARTFLCCCCFQVNWKIMEVLSRIRDIHPWNFQIHRQIILAARPWSVYQ